MTMRERSGSSRNLRSALKAEEFVVYVMGLPVTKSWEDLKDLGRPVTPNIRRAEVYTSPSGDSLGYGYISVIGEADGRRLHTILVKATKPQVHILGPSTAGTSQVLTRLAASTTDNAAQRSASKSVVPVPPLPTGYHDIHPLGASNSISTTFSSAGSHEQNVQAYYHYQTMVNNACVHANRDFASAAHEEQRGNLDRARLHWLDAQTQWSNQVYYQGRAYEAGNRMVLDETLVREAGSRVSLLAAQPSSPLATQYIPINGVAFHPVPSSTISYILSPAVVELPQPLQYTPQAVLQPSQIIHTNVDGTPINVSRGAVPTEARGVFIHELNYNATCADVANMMRQAGRVDRCEMNTYTSTAKSRGSASATFHNVEEAGRAVEMFDGTLFMGRKIRVRLDREVNSLTKQGRGFSGGCSDLSAGVTSRQQPIIVDGSIGSPPRNMQYSETRQ
ncbi:MAG: hypothetical protein M1830_004844 [Pleopsidium flavum]|nr:MAG: hypothetical protein M1830_004844 [Pleopsidium flavum]